MKLFKNPFFYTTVFSLSLLGLIIGSYVFGWVTPTEAPPGGNISLTSSQWTTSGSDIYYNTGNVGIGTSTPGAKLEVAGQIKITGGSPGAGKVLVSDANGLASWQALDSVPNQVTGLTATAGNNQVVLNWTAPADNGAAITSYKVYRGTTSGGETLLSSGGCSGLGNVLTCTDTGLTNGTPYYYKVSAVNGIGEGSQSAEVSATPVFTCGSSLTFTYKGSSVTYGTVSHNDKCWLDRNLGASQVATAYNDSLAYGDLFQWGRLDDGHQTRTSGTTGTLSSTDNPGHGNFILAPNSPYDWRSPQNDNLWQGVSGINNPCPSGWRIPTSAEWDAERASWSYQNYNGAFASPLKATACGERSRSDGALMEQGSYGYYWDSTVSGEGGGCMFFYGNGAGITNSQRAFGLAVRCVQD